MTRPPTDLSGWGALQANAWTGVAASSAPGPAWRRWSLSAHPAHEGDRIRSLLVAPDPPPDSDWRHPDVGWGLILADDPSRSTEDKAAAADAPEPIRELLASRPGSPVFRYRQDLNERYLQVYRPDGTSNPVSLTGGKRGIGRNALPRYLLIYGSPRLIPWRLQYVLETCAFVGRIDLEGEALGNYVSCLIDGWRDSAASREHPVLWSTDHGRDDITWLMRQVIARPLLQKLAADSEARKGLEELTGASATAANLASALARARPSWIVTTSHGFIDPHDGGALAREAGWLVDQEHAVVGQDALLGGWQPDGAIWYSHACCSAGTDDGTSYEGLLEEGTGAHTAVHRAAARGAAVATLPRALLGARRPLRAFIGHVEPTFNWTLRDPETQQVLTAPICTALYDYMYLKDPWPIGKALRAVHAQIGPLVAQWMNLKDARTSGDPERSAAAPLRALRTKLAAIDHQSCVLLGDPTVAMRPVEPGWQKRRGVLPADASAP